MVRKLLIALAALIVVFVGLVWMQPDEFRVARSVTIAAAPAAVFAEVNDLHRMETWNPWAKIDPNMKSAYEGPVEGEGASYVYEGNADVGKGRMTIVESRPSERVRLKLEFFEPFAGTSDAEFTFVPRDAATEVTWAMSGRNGFVGKAMQLILDIEGMIGEQFENGLADLKTRTEAAAKS